MAVPVVPTVAVGQQDSASWWNNSAAPPISWLLTNFSRCRVYDGVGVTVADATADVLMTWSTESYDNDTMHSTSSNTSRIVFTTAGLYETYMIFQYPSATYTVMNVNIKLNAAGNPASGTSIRNQNFQTARVPSYRFTRLYAAGDYIEVFLSQTSGASKTLVTGEFTTFLETRFIATS